MPAPSEERLRRIFQFLPLGLATLNQDGFVLSANPRLCRHAGWQFEALRKRLFTSFFPEEEEEGLLAAFNAALAGRFQRLEVTYRNPSRKRTLRLSLTLVPLAGDPAERVLAVIRDVTRLRAIQARAAARESAFRANEEIQRARLQDMVTHLEAANRLQEQFLASVTHEIRTPLTTVLIGSELLERELATTLSPAHAHHLEMVRRNARSLADLIDDLLDVAKLKRGAFAVEVDRVFLEEMVRSLREVSDPLFEKKGLSFRCTVGPSVPQAIETDGALLRRALLNLLHNAYKFTDSGQVSLEISASPGGLSFCVRDTGIGIPEDELPKIFEEFGQVGAGQRSPAGTGLGLSIADRLARLLGGRIEVESEPGQGSAFTLTIPQGA